MKTRLIASAFVLMFASGLLTAPAQAQTGWHDQAWRDMRLLAKAGAIKAGRTFILIQIERTCRQLNNGYSALAVLDAYSEFASQSARNVKELNEMTLTAEAIMAVAAISLGESPSHPPTLLPFHAAGFLTSGGGISTSRPSSLKHRV